MGRRREARENALKLLYSYDVGRSGPGDAPLEALWHVVGSEGGAVREDVREAAMRLAGGVIGRLDELDAGIAEYTANYSVGRIAAVDRNILRLAMYEMRHREDVPPVVAIDEAIEIAKKFGGEDSGRFVNGVLDRASRTLGRPLRHVGDG